MTDDETMSAGIRQVVLTHEKFALMQYVSRHLEVDVIPDVFGKMLAIRLSIMLLTDRIADDVYRGTTSLEFPSSPWQHFKQNHKASWWLRWLTLRRPVRTDSHTADYEVTWTKRATYPDARIEFPDLGSHVVYETVEGAQTRWTQ